VGGTSVRPDRASHNTRIRGPAAEAGLPGFPALLRHSRPRAETRCRNRQEAALTKYFKFFPPGLAAKGLFFNNSWAPSRRRGQNKSIRNRVHKGTLGGKRVTPASPEKQQRSTVEIQAARPGARSFSQETDSSTQASTGAVTTEAGRTRFDVFLAYTQRTGGGGRATRKRCPAWARLGANPTWARRVRRARRTHGARATVWNAPERAACNCRTGCFLYEPVSRESPFSRPPENGHASSRTKDFSPHANSNAAAFAIRSSACCSRSRGSWVTLEDGKLRFFHSGPWASRC